MVTLEPACVTRLANQEIAALLRKREFRGDWSGDGEVGSSSCDVVYMLFLEPSSRGEALDGIEGIADTMVRMFSPGSEPIVHCEILVPPIPSSHEGRINFATYLGQRAEWQKCTLEDGVNYYLVQNGERWRAVPVFAPHAASAVRVAADANVGAPYSIRRYVTSARPLRRFAWMLSDSPCAPGHCATLSARVLKQAGVADVLRHHSAWCAPFRPTPCTRSSPTRRSDV